MSIVDNILEYIDDETLDISTSEYLDVLKELRDDINIRIESVEMELNNR